MWKSSNAGRKSHILVAFASFVGFIDVHFENPRAVLDGEIQI